MPVSRVGASWRDVDDAIKGNSWIAQEVFMDHLYEDAACEGFPSCLAAFSPRRAALKTGRKDREALPANRS